jgi:ubiquitin-conjugating enzyme E2 variant
MSHGFPEQEVTALTKDYTRGRRAFDTIVIAVFFVVEAFVIYRAWDFLMENPLTSLIISFFGYVAADFISGFVHWMGDTWGTPSMPVIGQYLIRPFREHHVDQTAITRHGFTETNGANCLVTMIVLLPTISILYGSNSFWALGFHVFVFAMTMGVFGTNQFHRQAHLPAAERPRVIRWLQSLGLILGSAHHAKHHASPYDTYYCITVGWLNPILAKTRFFRVAEKIVTKITGAIPRKNDIVLTATKAVATVGEALGEVKDGVTGVMNEVGESIQPKHSHSTR